MIHDVTSAVRYLKAHSEEYGLDPEKFILWGETHGSYLACLCGIYGKSREYDDPECDLKEDASVAGVVDYWAMSDLEETYLDGVKNRQDDKPLIEELIFHKKGLDLISARNGRSF